jgi:hypothetical protein
MGKPKNDLSIYRFSSFSSRQFGSDYSMPFTEIVYNSSFEMKPDFTLEFIKDDRSLRRLSESLMTNPAFAVDIETVEWWNRQRERIALLQIAYRDAQKPKVSVIDAFASLDLEILKKTFEEPSIVKVIHNAAFDAPRIAKSYQINISPIHDTMLAARRNGERNYSLKAQAASHLGMHLDKSAQKSDWGKRPLNMRQLSYAALDAHATLLLYEHQRNRNLSYDYRLRTAEQNLLPLGETLEIGNLLPMPADSGEGLTPETELSDLSTALLGIVTTLPTRYSPDSLAVSLEAGRTGVAGWIIDQRIGKEAELDEETVKLAITDLCERKLLQITGMRRLEATATGSLLWENLK